MSPTALRLSNVTAKLKLDAPAYGLGLLYARQETQDIATGFVLEVVLLLDDCGSDIDESGVLLAAERLYGNSQHPGSVQQNGELNSDVLLQFFCENGIP
ncbi:hypothetical protein EJB05_43556, partial [Eragrostis curvula]